ncbi:hypothetical protein [Bifidobacterium castoris]|uniref:Uncharacterized protein n=1 Tax=Bifidobacterium castoris TaxID=2306972 RepID=A0A430FAG8_9BIFI|nr:hypothetical protein [Bifidobacterium castoris]RSX49826.1 hypothetical protein D2E22_0287 [Bifidobacterium castoris]
MMGAKMSAGVAHVVLLVAAGAAAGAAVAGWATVSSGVMAVGAAVVCALLPFLALSVPDRGARRRVGGCAVAGVLWRGMLLSAGMFSLLLLAVCFMVAYGVGVPSGLVAATVWMTVPGGACALPALVLRVWRDWNTDDGCGDA